MSFETSLRTRATRFKVAEDVYNLYAVKASQKTVFFDHKKIYLSLLFEFGQPW
jgi:hypothetical protein